ncbi:MAG: trypsin-like peptidase domain-containing protein [Planctomycetota bacterium]
MIAAIVWAAGSVRAGEPESAQRVDNDPVLRAEAARVETIARVAPAVVCVYDEAQRGGGSGVVIDREGYGLTNFHVVAGMMAKRRGWGGLGDGKLYELEVLGVDPTGDVAMFRLTGRDSFPFATLGDSDAVRVGDEVFAMGNPFVLSEDYTPSVSMGIVSGTHRYQYGVLGNLAYTDCIQVDAAINPGNSGGPLFNEAGEIIGINGRISTNTRGRFNVGHGYAISSNQIRRFIPALRAGLLARHGTLGATVQNEPRASARAESRRVVFEDVTPGGAADRAGIRRGDRLVTFDGTPMVSRNQFASLLGTYPADWPIVLEVDPDGRRREVVVRLDAVNPRMAAPFSAQREVNLREVRRLLRGFRRAVLRDAAAEVPRRWRWTALRKYAPDGGSGAFDEKYDLSFDGEGPVRMVRRYEDGEHRGPVIVYDDASAVKHLTEDGDAMELPTEDKMVLGALYLLQRRFLSELSDADLANVAVAGGDAIAEVGGRGGGSGEGAAGAGGDVRRAASAALEVLDWPIGGQTLAKFVFDPDTGRVVRIRVRDVPTGAEATIDFMDYGWVAGIVWPQALEVRSHSQSYREKLSDWKLGE